MELNVFVKNMENTPSIESRIEDKVSKLKKYFEGKMKVDWHCQVIKDEHHSEATVHGDGYHYHASASADNLYKTFDLVLSKLEKQLARKSQQTKEKIHRKHDRPVVAEEDETEAEY